MAGIGFELRRLTLQDDLLGIVQGYAHSATTAAGPWLFTILTLAGVVLVGSTNVAPDDMTTFRLIIIYNFSFSLVLSGPFVMVATRVLADGIYFRDVRKAPSMMLGYLAILFAVQALPVGAFYLWFVNLDLSLSLVAILNFFVVSGIWLISTFLTALKDYTTITRSFAIGMGTSFVAAIVLAGSYSITGMLLGFSVGLALIFFVLTARVFAEYPYRVVRPFEFGRYFSKYWELALTGLAYNTAIWVDKWVMWFSPNRVVLESRMVSYPDYDSAMFLAFLTIVPSLAMFVLNIETQFFEKYVRFYRDIQKHADYDKIVRNQGHLIEAVLGGARNFIILQGSISLTVILLAPRIFDYLGINFAQLGIFRIGVLGAFFHVLFLAMSILLAYFDLRMIALRVHLFFLITNGVFSFVSMRLGFPYYGLGYFLSALATFVVTFFITAQVLDQLPYRTFVLDNESVRE